ncbi:MAG: sulfotransferase [Burkholderiaceae bacterium]|nr:sulfotransferase [Burkholderiaceae bacterium]
MQKQPYGSRSGPFFLGIGAPRCGTTWLYRALLVHPDLWLPPIKELHYFDSIDESIDEGFRAQYRGYRMERHLWPRMRHYLAAPGSSLASSVRERLRLEPSWDVRYFLGDGTIKRYNSLFAVSGDRKVRKGEITPAYIMLSRRMIERIRTETAVQKIILLLRNPIEASWSLVRKNVRDRALEVRDTGVEHLEAILLKDSVRRRYAYGDALERWLTEFRSESVFIGYYEELTSDPQGLLRRICSFLEVPDLHDELHAKLPGRVNSAQGVLGSIPATLVRALASEYVPQLRRLASITGDNPYTRAWLHEAESYVT